MSRAEDDFFAFAGEPLDQPRKRRKKKKSRPDAGAKSPSVGETPPLFEKSPETEVISVEDAKPAAYGDLIEQLGLEASVVEARRPAVVKTKKSRAVEPSTDDLFLKQLDKDVALSQPDAELDELLEKYGSTERTVLFNGKQIPVKQAVFALTVQITLANSESLGFRLRVRSNAQFKTILREIMNQLRAHGRELAAEQAADTDSLVFYIEDQGIILTQDLKVGSLVRSGARLRVNDVGDAFEVVTVLLTDAAARGRKRDTSIEKLLLTDDQAESLDGESDELILTLVDPQRGGQTTAVSARVGTTVKELLDVFLVRMNYPDGLAIDLQHKGLVLDHNTLVSLDLRDNDVLEVLYNIHDLDKFQDQAVSSDEDVIETTTSDNYFSIKLKGRDRKEVRARVNPDTRIEAIARFYLQKCGLGPETQVRLIFDDEALDPGQTVGQTELEDDYLVDVEII
ncbi:hypothetical protein OGAPHI_001680 [Ogataea philodendri]|uniref:Rad60/SUMO-like domain-containing protein n=1 Tax=Ogataea philodendri TaxID=1378263 RepID=A0A9P8PCS0_9ASCO|nr:uncharacterized protein OGAPHI_001680 [Ogataea philodendri]KAH3669084.1 hypothetical protein OGAPHI_001680 [Ogataea philodendri]